MDWFVIDYFTGQKLPRRKCIRFINDIVDDVILCDYTNQTDKLLEVGGPIGASYYNKERFEDRLIFDKSTGAYRIIQNINDNQYIYCQYGSTVGYYYSFTKVYGANKHLDLFAHRQQLIDPEIDFKLSHFLKYTLGVEFETATGIIPENICFRDGLIPLRDGSITGNEYSTVVLEGNHGLNLLKQQIQTMKEYTYFDKNCSLHIHLGNIPLEPNFIYNVYKICVKLQDQIHSIVPEFTFNSSMYKNTGKDYCKKLPTNLLSFEQFYRYMVGLNYFGDLNQPHPMDITRDHKWNIDKRYYFVNFINALCYRSGKTIEFRFLRPTYNINKIIFWLYIFNAILLCAENNYIPENLEALVVNIYPEQIAKDLMKNIVKCRICTNIQTTLDDRIGARTDIEDHIFNTNELI